MTLDTGLMIWLGGALGLLLMTEAAVGGLRQGWRVHLWLQAAWLILSLILFLMVVL